MWFHTTVYRLNEIYNEYKDEGFEILDFPCGENASPLFEYLKAEQPFKGLSGKGATKLKLAIKAMRMNYEENDIRWNFTKFLVDRQGNPVRRFEPTEDLGDVKDAIKELL